MILPLFSTDPHFACKRDGLLLLQVSILRSFCQLHWNFSLFWLQTLFWFQVNVKGGLKKTKTNAPLHSARPGSLSLKTRRRVSECVFTFVKQRIGPRTSINVRIDLQTPPVQNRMIRKSWWENFAGKFKMHGKLFIYLGKALLLVRVVIGACAFSLHFSMPLSSFRL